MHIDLNLVPNTLDAVHVGLAAALFVLLALQVVLLSVAVIALIRRGRSREEVRPIAEPAPVAVPAPAPRISEIPGKPEPALLREASPDSALQLLGLLQTEARFIDFVQENVAGFTDAEIGAAARIVHEGCRKVLRQHFELEPVRAEAENSRVTLARGFDASAVRLTGNIVGEAPFTGTLVHRGWRVGQVRLPKVAEGHDTRIVAAAEVEL
jgi:hypothetical protein